MFAVALSLERRRCLVVGAGGVALRKILSLVDEQAFVTVVAPAAVAEVEALAHEGRIELERRPYRPGEAGEDYALVFAATDNRDVNRQVFEEGTAAGVFVNVADDPELCSFHLPARVRRGRLELTVASGGGAPFLVRRIPPGARCACRARVERVGRRRGDVPHQGARPPASNRPPRKRASIGSSAGPSTRSVWRRECLRPRRSTRG